jgi:hypothetical protein
MLDSDRDGDWPDVGTVIPAFKLYLSETCALTPMREVAEPSPTARCRSASRSNVDEWTCCQPWDAAQEPNSRNDAAA